jgi:hypothetical protein
LVVPQSAIVSMTDRLPQGFGVRQSPGALERADTFESGRRHLHSKTRTRKTPEIAKRTQIENHKLLSINMMRKHGLASFSKRTHFPGYPKPLKAIQRFQAFPRLSHVCQTFPSFVPKPFQGCYEVFQAFPRHFQKKRLFIFYLPSTLPWPPTFCAVPCGFTPLTTPIILDWPNRTADSCERLYNEEF